MLGYFLDSKNIDVFDPFNILPIEKVITCLGERR